MGQRNHPLDIELGRAAEGTLRSNVELLVECGAFSNRALSGRVVAGDTNSRTKILAGGPIDFGPGDATPDVQLARKEANTPWA